MRTARVGTRSMGLALPRAGKSRQPTFWLSAVLIERLLTRLFTEKFAVLPGWVNYFDLVMLVLLSVHVAFFLRGRSRQRKTGFAVPVALLLMQAAVSTLLNLGRVNGAAASLFVFGLIEPLLFMGLAYALSPGRETVAFLERLLYRFGWLQIVVVVFLDLPRFLATGNPDLISGTFGENAYQLTYFLLAWNGLFLLRQSRRANRIRAAFLSGAVEIITLTIILLAQFRSILPFAAFTWLLTHLIVNRPSARGLAATGLGMLTAVVVFIQVDRQFPHLKWGEVLQIPQRSDEAYQSGKVQSVLNFGQLVGEQPQVLLVGTGPGTYASRGFRTFSIAGRDDVVNVWYRDIFGADYYVTDVAARYVLPVARYFAFGAATTAGPWFSYLSIPAELGLPGLAIVLVIYLRGIYLAWRAFILRRQRDQETASLALFAMIALVLLLQMGFIENWLETSRATVPAWTILGVVLAQFKPESASPDNSMKRV